MKYSINVTEAKNQDGNVRGFANLVFGDSFKITNIAILENKEKGTLFVSMPRYNLTPQISGLNSPSSFSVP